MPHLGKASTVSAAREASRGPALTRNQDDILPTTRGAARRARRLAKEAGRSKSAPAPPETPTERPATEWSAPFASAPAEVQAPADVQASAPAPSWQRNEPSQLAEPEVEPEHEVEPELSRPAPFSAFAPTAAVDEPDEPGPPAPGKRSKRRRRAERTESAEAPEIRKADRVKPAKAPKMAKVPKPKTERRLSRALGRLVRTLLVVVGVLVVSLGAVVAGSGLRPTAVQSLSMEPTVPAGSMALMKRVAARNVNLGDVVAVERDGHVPVLLRVVAVDGIGSTAVLSVRGEGGRAADTTAVTVSEVDRLEWHVPYVGRAGAVATAPGFVLGVLVTALVMRRRRPILH